MTLNVEREPGLCHRAYILGLIIVLSLWGLISAEPFQPLAQSNAKLSQGVWYTSADRLGYLGPTVPQDLQQIKTRLCPDYIQLTVYVYQATKNSSDPHIDPARTVIVFQIGG
ncbi:hypothetical protein HY009_07315 [Candidatus Acetothermia bacterium]|nr:hypothetical protein [Candidatus Acetothermia bacterium]